MHPVYYCMEDYLANSREILNARALMYILMYLFCGVYCVTLSSGGFFRPLAGWPEPHFADLFQPMNKLTDLPYPISCCPHPLHPLKLLSSPHQKIDLKKSTKKKENTMRINTAAYRLGTFFLWGTESVLVVTRYNVLAVSPHLILVRSLFYFQCKWCHTFTECKCLNMVTS